MKSNRVLVNTVYAFVFLAFIACPVQSIFYPGAGTIQEQNTRQNSHSLIMDIYNAIYCSHKRCPNWRCQDDSAVIHGYCCGCPQSFLDNAPVLCVDDLKCPLKMNNLCEDYHFMIACCCSRRN